MGNDIFEYIEKNQGKTKKTNGTLTEKDFKNLYKEAKKNGFEITPNTKTKDFNKYMELKKHEKFMRESNLIEGEDRLNPGDMKAIEFAIDNGFHKEKDFFHVHKLLGEYLNVDWVGKWRTVNVRVGSHCPVDFKYVPKQMETYIRQLPMMTAWDAHNEFEGIHPLRDLNGRMGRLIWVSKAIKEGYGFEISFLHTFYYSTLERYEEIRK